MADYIVRAIAADGQIRVFAVTSRDLVERARVVHNTSPVVTAALGRLLTGAAMMGITMKNGDDLLTIKLQCDGPVKGLTVTADAAGNVKGFACNPCVFLPPNAQGKLDVGGALGLGVLSVIKDIGMKEPYVGQTILVSSEIAEDLTYYYATSEQTPSSVALGVLMNRENTVKQAGGFMIQMMPDASEEVIAALERRLGEMRPVTAMLDDGMSPEMILMEVFGGQGVEILERIPAQFTCNCSKERVEQVMISIGKTEIQSMILDGKPAEVTCDFCNRHYQFGMDRLKSLLEQAK